MCSFTWLVQIVTWPEQFISSLHLEKMMAASKLQNERLVKYVNKDMTKIFGIQFELTYFCSHKNYYIS